MEALLSKDVLLGLFVLSIVGFIGSLIAIPFILVRLPPHYFDERHPRTWMENHHPVLRLTGLILKMWSAWSSCWLDLRCCSCRDRAF